MIGQLIKMISYKREFKKFLKTEYRNLYDLRSIMTLTKIFNDLDTSMGYDLDPDMLKNFDEIWMAYESYQNRLNQITEAFMEHDGERLKVLEDSWTSERKRLYETVNKYIDSIEKYLMMEDRDLSEVKLCQIMKS